MDYFSHHIGNGKIIPTDFHSIIFQRGRYTMVYHQPDIHMVVKLGIYIYIYSI